MKKLRRFSTAIVAVLTILILVSCSTTEDGQANPTETTAIPTTTDDTESTGTNNDSLAPPVEDPKDVGGVDICTVLAPESATELGFDPEGIPQESAVNASSDPCSWETTGRNDGSGVYIYSDVDRTGLNEMYLLRGDAYPDFREFEIAGYPAVQASLGGATDTSCEIHIGVAEDQFITISAGLGFDEEGDPCQLAVRTAESVVPGLPTAE
ncbi:MULTISPECIES: DUF3558 domain-containing protein [Actinoalloteichus]|uniref:DUF3558 domain-containing protein n=1 Tax=Actinoalloteichus TaxID=65496 RepID=UPI0009524141|nr:MULTISPECIES: DUF3558 domain-containing protein [Actinoalloteichus]